MNTLEVGLAKEFEVSSKGLPEWLKKYTIKKIIDVGRQTKPLRVGERWKDGKLMNHLGRPVVFSKLLAGKPAIISFYRGAWCPYCNLELRHYDDLISQRPNDEIRMFAISPEKPDETMKSVDIEKLHYQVLSDIDNKYAAKVGLVYKLSTFLKIMFKAKGANLKQSQGNKNAELPIPATYVIDRNGIISNAWLDPNFTKRAEPADVLDAYNKCLIEQ